MIYVDFESILVSKDNRQQNPEEHSMNKYQRYVARSCSYMLVYFGGKFSKPYKSYLGEDAVYSFINSIIKESKTCTGIIKKYFHKELAFVIILILRVMLQ